MRDGNKAMGQPEMNKGWADYLQDGETILWEGRPDARIFLMSVGDKYRLVLAGLWLIFMLYFYERSFDGGVLVLVNFFRAMPPAILLLFILAVLYFTIGRWIVDAHIRRHTVYAISNKRAFIAKSAFERPSLAHMPIVAGMNILVAKGAMGAICFDQKKSLFKNWNRWGVDDGSFSFRGLTEPEKLYTLIEGIQRQEMPATR